MPIPERLYTHVLAFVRERLVDSAEDLAGVTATNEVVESGDPAFWSLKALALLRDQLRYEGARVAMELAAREAPRPISITRVERETPSRTPREIAADLGALTKLCRKLFHRKNWPMRAVEMWSQDENRWCMHYAMHPEVAERWLSLLASESSPDA